MPTHSFSKIESAIVRDFDSNEDLKNQSFDYFLWEAALKILRQNVAESIGQSGIDLIHACAALDINFSDCLNTACKNGGIKL